MQNNPVPNTTHPWAVTQANHTRPQVRGAAFWKALLDSFLTTDADDRQKKGYEWEEGALDKKMKNSKCGRARYKPTCCFYKESRAQLV